MSADNYNVVCNKNGCWSVYLNLSASGDEAEQLAKFKPEEKTFDKLEDAISWAEAQGYTEYGTTVRRRDLSPDKAITQIASILSGTKWDAETMNQIAEVVAKAGYEFQRPGDPARDHEPPPIMCPKCTCIDVEQMQVVEQYTAYHPIRGRNDGDQPMIENVLGMTCPSEHFDDGEGTYKVHCGACGHVGETEEFGLGDGSDWEWV